MSVEHFNERLLALVSIRTPVLRPECQVQHQDVRQARGCFNPHPGPSTGVSHEPDRASPQHSVSIRTPVLRPECRVTNNHFAQPYGFNPHPGPSTGVSAAGEEAVAKVKFQSAPRSFDRSVPLVLVVQVLALLVSIRTPVLRPECPSQMRSHAPGSHVSIRTPVLRPECRFGCSTASGMRRFQSAPRSFDRSVTRKSVLSPPPSCFNPHPGPSTGVSTSGPLSMSWQTMFQSAPRSFDRSVKISMSRSWPLISFQSAPRSFDRSVRRLHSVESEGDLFQSAPRSFDRSVPLLQTLGRVGRGFNPHPGPSTGVSAEGVGAAAAGAVSIRTPVLRPECRARVARGKHARRVSIRTPVLRPECRRPAAPRPKNKRVSIRTPVLRPECLALELPSVPEIVFQSAPRSFDRSVAERTRLDEERRLFQSAPRSFDRSVPARRSGSTLRARFNPHPGPSTGVSGARPPRWPVPQCFNPHPGPSTGVSPADLAGAQQTTFQSAPRSFDRSVHSLCVELRIKRVSIRTPVLRPECPLTSGSCASAAMFQSAPRSFDRSVSELILFGRPLACFNPHPGPSTGVSRL